MAQDKVDIALGSEGAQAALDALIAKAKQLTEELRKAGTQLGANPSQQSAANLFSTAQQLSSVNSAVSALQNSATTGGVASAATSGANAFGRGFVMRTPSDPGAIAGVLQNAGVSGYGFGIAAGMLANGAIPQMPGSFNGAQYVQQVVNSAQSSMPAPSVYGPSTPVGPPGLQMNTWLYNQGQQRASWAQTQGTIARSALAGIGVLGAAGALNSYARNTASGDYDPMQGSSYLGGLMGAGVGFVAGALLSPLAPGTGAATGALAGQQLGSAMFQAVTAPFIRQRNTELALQSIAARQDSSTDALAGSQTGAFRLDSSGRPKFRFDIKKGEFGFDAIEQTNRTGALSDLSERISFGGKSFIDRAMIKLGIYTGKDIISLQQTAETYSTFGSALLAAGDDPQGAYDLTSRTARKYYMGAPRMAAMAAPVIAARARYNGNAADLALAAGPEAYGAYADATGTPDLTGRQRRAYGNIQTGDYLAQRASLQTRGSGAAAAVAYAGQMVDISALPGGRDSLAYAESSARYRDSMYQSYEQQDAAGYGLASTKLAGRQQRAELLPYAPANMLGLGVQRLGLNRQQIRTVEGRLKSLRASGNLTEDEELRLTGQIEDLRTQNAGVISRLSDGMEDRLPALSAGANSFAGRYRSTNLAALNLAMMGSPIRAWGATNGSQLRAQRQFVSDLGGTESDVAPRSRTAALNTDLGEVLSRLTNVLEKLASTAPNPMRPTELAGSAYANQQRADTGAGRIYGTSN